MAARPQAASSSRPRAVVRASKGQDLARAFSAVSAELDALTEALKSPSTGSAERGQTSTRRITLPDDSQELLCDENGCVLLDKKSGNSVPAARGTGGVTTSLDTLLSGEGWVLGVLDESAADAAASSSASFAAVIGGNGWTVSLTQAELDDFVLALQRIHTTLRDLVMQQEQQHGGKVSGDPLRVKWECNTTIMEATAPPGVGSAELHGYNLIWKIGAGRAVRATWSADMVADVLDALSTYRQGQGAVQARQQAVAA